MTTSYWQKRSEQIARKQHQKADDFEKRASRQYKRAAKSIKEDLESFYARYADANGITMAQTKRLLSKEELGNFKITLEEFREKALANQDGRWTKELDSIYIRSRISRLQALQTQIRGHLNELGHEQARSMTGLLGDVYKDTYYRTLHQIQTGTGVGVSFARINDAALDKVLNKPWAGSNFSKRIWKDKRKLQAELERVISNSFIRGDSLDKTIRAFLGRMDVSRSNAERIIQSEVAFFTEQASAAGYVSSGVVEKYEILATLDGRTSSTCRSMDGKVFAVSEMVVGETYPPFHVRCRSTTVPFFDDEWFSGDEERAAKGRDGKTYYVPANKSYEDWYREHVQKDSKKGIINYKQFASHDEVKAWETEVTPKWIHSLTSEETEGIYRYTGTVYERVNQYLRDGGDAPDLDKLIDSISSGLGKFDLQENIVVHRGLKKNIFASYAAEDLVGVTFVDKGFMSTSLLKEKQFSGRVQMKINAPAKSRGALINPLSMFQDEEYEFLFDAGTEMKILDAVNEDGKLKLEVEVIGNVNKT